MEVDGAGMDGGEGALGLDVAQHLAGGGVDYGHAVRGRGAQGDSAGDELPAASQVAVRAPAAQLAPGDQPLGSLAPTLAQDLVVLRAERGLVGGREQVLQLDLLGAMVQDGRLDRPLQELVGMAAEELVESVLARDVDGEPAAAAPGAPPHLPEARDGAGEVDADRGVELADVDPELEGVGGGDREQLARGELRLDLAALLGRVAGPVGGDALG